MQSGNPVLPQELEDFINRQKKELYSIREAFSNYGTHDELCSKAFQSFVDHRIDDHLRAINEYFHKTSKEHHLTPAEIDAILHYVMKDLHLVASISSSRDLTEDINPKKLILNWLKQNLLTAYRTKEPKVKILGELFRQYVVADNFEKEPVYERIKYYLNIEQK
jgi:hypothetical protein